jgi:hypothetical protein
VGVNIHTTIASDVVYQYRVNHTNSDNPLSGAALNLIQIHNGGKQ